MKTFKQLLWFIIPSIIIIALLLVMTFVPQSDLPKFIGPQKYFKLFVKDPLFVRALFNSLIKPFSIAFAVGLIIFILKSITAKNATKKWVSPLFYTCLFIISSTVFHITSYLGVIFGLPTEAYTASTLVLNLSDISAKLQLINIPALLFSMQIGVFICFVFWLVNKLLRVFASRRNLSNTSIIG